MRRLLFAAMLVTAVPLGPAAQAPTPPTIPYEVDASFFKVSPDMNFGEVLGVAVNSRGHVVVLNHPGSATAGPIYGNATTQLWEFDANGYFVREIGKGVYALAYAHSVRFDKYDNLWVVDKATNAVIKFNPAGLVTLNLGRRPEGYDSYAGEYERPTPAEAKAIDGQFNGPTDVSWDSDDNIYVSDGYVNSRIAKMDKWGYWIKSWGSNGSGGDRADQNPGQFRNPHNMQLDRQGNVYAADRGNRRIQVFDKDGNFLRFMHLNAPYDKTRHPTLANTNPNPPVETAPWTICISEGPTQYLYVSDTDPGRLYKMSLDGKILGMFGRSGRGPGEFNWVHGIACRNDNEIYVADMNNWRVLKLTLRAGPKTSQ